jgi:integrase-like protein
MLHPLTILLNFVKCGTATQILACARQVSSFKRQALSNHWQREGCRNSSAPNANRRNRFEFALFVDAGKLSPMNSSSRNSANPLIAKVQQLFSRDLALENDYLRQENKILRSKLGARVPLSESDRRILVKYGLRIKDRLAAVISIAKPDTLLSWNRRQKQNKRTFENHKATAGRPRKAGDIEALIVRLAQDNNSWGYKRLSGELKKLGHRVCPSYVREVLRRHGLPPAPDRRGLSWKQFLQSHLEVTWATDFLTEEVWTMGGLSTFYILFFLHLGSRRVWIAGWTRWTPQPHTAWMAQQARNFSMMVEDWYLPCRYLIHDRDTSFMSLDGVLKTDQLRILKTPPHSPLCNAHAERHVREIRETLDNLILLGEPHLRRALRAIQCHHNAQRPHQGIGNVIPLGFDYPAEPASLGEIQCAEALGGLLNHYSVKKAA